MQGSNANAMQCFRFRTNVESEMCCSTDEWRVTTECWEISITTQVNNVHFNVHMNQIEPNHLSEFVKWLLELLIIRIIYQSYRNICVSLMYNDQVNKISNVMESRDGLECYDRKAAQLPSFRVSQVDLLQAWKLLLQPNILDIFEPINMNFRFTHNKYILVLCTLSLSNVGAVIAVLLRFSLRSFLRATESM